MQIILVSRHLKAARTVTIMPWHWAVAAISLLAAIGLAAVVLAKFILPMWAPPASETQDPVASPQYLRNNLNLMATRLGELQAKLVHLDGVGARLAGLAGIRYESAGDSAKQGGQGGAFVPAPMSSEDLLREIERLAGDVEAKSDTLAAIESKLLEQRVRERLLPTTLPVQDSALGSPYGYRNDPVLGLKAMHEGIDFNAEVGTPVIAAADGVVSSAGWQGDFGNLVELDHGEGLSTRYAHLSRIDVKPGSVVKRGTQLGALGNTGRSTGPHLHFEVRMLGVAQNPAVFLKNNEKFAALPRR